MAETPDRCPARSSRAQCELRLAHDGSHEHYGGIPGTRTYWRDFPPLAETPRRIEIPAGSPLGQILRDGITTAGEIREGDLIVYANPPAAPSVGEPEPSPHCVCGHRLDRHLHTLPAGTLPCLSMLCWCSSFRAVDPVPDRPPTLDDFARLLALGATSEGTYLTPDQSLALRSSLEEARKDSERLDWLSHPRPNVSYGINESGLIPGCSLYVHDDGMPADGDTLRESIDLAMSWHPIPPRAPSPRDEP